ncbi:hypothetical protein EJ08DRAFT_739254 [Tothia fuscella]|uniref:Uncharacterized protein n=1 Tax=Tothia fuscella TaxID=1048955 RepID=A0A9P4NF26_9PEZI|nr:hypothetical protein EJ08DRAFT_739254 [Tothia fuscella]
MTLQRRSKTKPQSQAQPQPMHVTPISTLPPIMARMTIENWYDWNLKDEDLINREVNAYISSKRIDRVRRTAVLRLIPHAIYPLTVTERHRYGVELEYYGLKNGDKRAVVAIIHASVEDGWKYTSWHLDDAKLPEHIPWGKLDDQVYRNVIALFICKGSYYAGVPVVVEERVKQVDSLIEVVEVNAEDNVVKGNSEDNVVVKGCSDEDKAHLERIDTPLQGVEDVSDDDTVIMGYSDDAEQEEKGGVSLSEMYELQRNFDF